MGKAKISHQPLSMITRDVFTLNVQIKVRVIATLQMHLYEFEMHAN